MVDLTDREDGTSEKEWFRKVEIRARFAVFQLQLEGKSQTGPAVIKWVFLVLNRYFNLYLLALHYSKDGKSLNIPWYELLIPFYAISL